MSDKEYSEDKMRDFQRVQDWIENEGFDYTFMDYSTFGYLKDEKFHELRKMYIKAHNDLQQYINENIGE